MISVDQNSNQRKTKITNSPPSKTRKQFFSPSWAFRATDQALHKLKQIVGDLSVVRLWILHFECLLYTLRPQVYEASYMASWPSLNKGAQIQGTPPQMAAVVPYHDFLKSSFPRCLIIRVFIGARFMMPMWRTDMCTYKRNESKEEIMWYFH